MARKRRQSPTRHVPTGTTAMKILGIAPPRRSEAHSNRTNDVLRGHSRKAKHSHRVEY